MPGLVTVTVPPATAKLTTLATAQADLGTTSDVSSLIDRASATIATHCGRAFGLQTISEQFRRPTRYTYASSDTLHRLHADPKPLNLQYDAQSIVSVTEDGNALTAGTDYEADVPAGMLWRLYGDSRKDWYGRVTVVVYTTGWNLPNDGSRNMPADLEDACLTLVRSAFYGQGRNPNVAMDLTEGVGRVQYWDRSISSMIIDQPMSDALAGYVVRVW